MEHHPQTQLQIQYKSQEIKIPHSYAGVLSNNIPIHLDKTKRDVIENIIEYLLSEMALGNTCIYLSQYITRPSYKTPNSNNPPSVDDIMHILLSSNLSAVVSLDIDNIKNTPLPIFTHPLILVKRPHDYALFFARYLHYEISIIKQTRVLHHEYHISHDTQNEIDSFINDIVVKIGFPNPEQTQAIKKSIINKFSIIGGGPGTGKTTTITILLLIISKMHIATHNQPLQINIVAPTGKASARVRESIANSINILSQHGLMSDKMYECFNNIKYSTIHKLLGYKHGSIYFKYNAINKLSTDVLIIDEASMIGLPLMYKLLSALDDTSIKHIIALGDKNQLPAIEEGNVFHSLMNDNKNVVSFLMTSNRNKGDINILLEAILKKDHILLESVIDNSDVINLYPCKLKSIIDEILQNDSHLSDYVILMNPITTPTYKELTNQFIKSTILCLQNNGTLGVLNLNYIIEAIIKDKLLIENTWYTGRPILILENNEMYDIHNGDIGTCIMMDGKPIIHFENGKQYSPDILPKYQLAYAITIHKSQGSEYNHVNIILGDANTNRLTCELLYTAISRSKFFVNLFGSFDLIHDGINHQTSRRSLLSIMHMCGNDNT